MTFKNLLSVAVRAPPAFHEAIPSFLYPLCGQKPPPVLNSDRTFARPLKTFLKGS